jgi:RNA polymerase sigma factor (TIGR02999 family)
VSLLEKTTMRPGPDSGPPESAATFSAEQLLPIVSDELLKLAGVRLAREKPGHLLQPAALVHEAWLRLFNENAPQRWDSEGHFFAAAAEAMRRILIEKARKKRRAPRFVILPFRFADGMSLTTTNEPLDLLAINEAISILETAHPEKAQVVKLRFFDGLTHHEIAVILDVSLITVKRHWKFARVWLHRQMRTRNKTRGSSPVHTRVP